MTRHFARFASIALSLFLAAGPAFPWGTEGHRVVALVAAKSISAATRAKLALILSTNDAGLEAAMATAATWPDKINKKTTKTENWHFIDVPVTAAFSVGNLCATHDCVIDRILEMQDRLQNNRKGFSLAVAPSPSRPMTSQELAFLIHFVGDIHQPLHAATNGDRGGNCVDLTNPISHQQEHSRDTTELHAVWDVDEVDAVFDRLGDEDQTAETLAQQVKSGTVKVVQLAPQDWAKESNALAITDVYRKLGIPGHTAPPNTCAPGIAKVTLSPTYLVGNANDVALQLTKAGIRLARILDQICASNGCSAKP
jgi:hypothetical protein